MTGPGETTSTSLFAKCLLRDGVLMAKLITPSIGQRESPIITQLIATELEAAGTANPPRALVLDFSQVTFLNSMGLGMCIDLRNRMAVIKGRVILYGVNTQLLETLKLTKMDRLFTIVDDVKKLEAAVAR
ncbi:MAG TPA: STAS domain-containing protein [Phycisphaerales bacterium]|nr:STAS domain-containing protein [Phycisphaerales bacterium]HRQ74375.1 STAS domain-containing protein [Phycisphaerales bacterium]